MSDMPTSARDPRAQRHHSSHRSYDVLLLVVISFVLAMLLFVLLATPT